ncbi:MAG TPA: hypothetical protein VGH28_05430 [Polyangiaceae bacterium]
MKEKKLGTVTRDEIARALGEAKFDPPHGNITSLPQPYQLAIGDVALKEIVNPRGTIVVIGNLVFIVTKDMTVRHAYFDAFLVVGGTLRGKTIVADSTWNGGLFAGGVEADTLVLKDCGLELLGKAKKPKVKRLADFEKESAAKKAVPELFADEDVDAYGFFLALKR